MFKKAIKSATGMSKEMNKNLIVLEFEHNGKKFSITKKEFKKYHCGYSGKGKNECEVFQTRDGRKTLCPFCEWFVKFDIPRIIRGIKKGQAKYEDVDVKYLLKT